jgi:hypothetical protein
MTQPNGPRIPLGWILYDRPQAQAAGIDLERRELLYALQVDDLIDAYAAFITHNPDAPEGEPTWDEMSAEDKDGLIRVAIKYLEQLIDEHWKDTLMDAILDYNSDKGGT